MSFFRKLTGQRGDVLQPLILLTMVAGITAMLGKLVVGYSRVAQKKVRDNGATLSQTAGIETLLVAYRYAELKYLKALVAGNCATSNPFLQALHDGSGCPSAGSISVFDPQQIDGGTVEQHPGKHDPLYRYVQACTITATGSSCANGLHEVLDVDNASPTEVKGNTRALAEQAMYRFFLNAISPAREIAEFSATVKDGATQSRFAFAVRGSLPNAAHLEVDGRVTQENPDPLARCGGTVWADFLVFDPASQNCLHFAQLGSGTGLAFHGGRYFGFRPFDGQVIDLLSASNNSGSYLVDQTGNVSGQHVFPAYDMATLVNVDDITTIGDQVYFVAGQASSAQIGVLSGNQRIKICDLGAMGWGQAYEGIAALGRSDPLLAKLGDGYDERLATFFLKTSGGDLLTASVIGNAAGNVFQCLVMKDANLQQVEYRRTYGFDRTDTNKPYYLY